ncbi:uncharacterized protein [Halyomorpha halys]|uniref:uncharacterized protein n=1 Tax=Halyomorpha halys TaxID=286706 RepID=UPI0006D4EA03|nr:uncharacterized protein LOC106688539 [Halyomorpha halys]
MVAVILILVSAISAAQAACEYKIDKMEMKTCKGEPINIWTLTGLGAEFTDNCDVLVKGCAKMHTDLQSVVSEYKAFKDGMEVSKGKYSICGMTLFDTKFECPLAKGKDFCATKNWVTKVPKSLLSLAVGDIRSEVTLKTSEGVFCYVIKATIRK